MTIITVDGKRIGSTKCYHCNGDITLEQIATGSAWCSHRIDGDSAHGWIMVHNKCADASGISFIGSDGTWKSGESPDAVAIRAALYPYAENPF